VQQFSTDKTILVITQPPYSPGLIPSDFWLFPVPSLFRNLASPWKVLMAPELETYLRFEVFRVVTRNNIIETYLFLSDLLCCLQDVAGMLAFTASYKH
jgi:hypothetical protein